MIDHEKENKIERLANRVAERRHEETLSVAVSKIASEEKLNDHEIRDLCARSNHLVNSILTKEDAMSTFKIARFEEVKGIAEIETNKKVAYDIYNSQGVKSVEELRAKPTARLDPDIAEMRKLANMYYPNEEQYYDERGMPQEEQMSPMQQEAYPPEQQMDPYQEQPMYPPEQPVSEMELADNVLTIEDDIEDSKFKINQNIEEVYGIAKHLVQEGTPVEEVIEALNTTVLENYPGLQDFIVQDIIDRLQEEGLVETEEEQPLHADMYPGAKQASVKNSKLSKIAQEIEEEVTSYVEKCGQQGLFIDKLAADYGWHSVPRMVHGKYNGTVEAMAKLGHRYLTKIGFFDLNPRQTADSVNTVRDLFRVMMGTGTVREPDPSMTDKIVKNVGRGALGSLGALGATYGTMAVANKVNDLVKRKKANNLKSVLPERYPDLKEIPYDLYTDLYDTVTTLTPSMTEAPYALYQVIKGQAAYGAMDASTMALLAKAEKDMGRGKGYQTVPEMVSAAVAKESVKFKDE